MKEFIDKLIGRLEEEKKEYSRMASQMIRIGNDEIHCHYERMFVAMCNAIEIVNELAEEYINTSTISKMETVGWIPCERELPDEYAEVLGYGIDGHIYMVELYDTKIYGKVWKQWNGGDIRLKFIEAWMPLPAPYTEGE